MKWELIDEDETDFHGYNLLDNINRGIVLVVGFVPGLKVEAIPLLRPKNVRVSVFYFYELLSFDLN